jgi:DNA-directed RNA polymerase subunit RPC12/RpoP
MSDRGLAVTNYSPWPKDTRARCPQCRSGDLLALGRVLADTTGMIRNAYRCRECAEEFLLFSTDRRIGPRDRRTT